MRLPQVAHNYRREHELNMWFVLATETKAGIAEAIAQIEQDTGLPVYAFPKEREYFVEMKLEASADDRCDLDRALIVATQGGLPLVPRPYHAVAEQTGYLADEVSVAALAGDAGQWGDPPYRRRAQSLRHRLDGQRHDVFGCVTMRRSMHWAADRRLAFVTHCYRRPRHCRPGPTTCSPWCTAARATSVATKAAEIRALLGDACRGTTFCIRPDILKKSGLRIAR